MSMLEGWRNVPISDLATFHSGGTPNKGQPTYWGGSTPWVTVKDMKAMRLHDVGESLTKAGADTVRIVPVGTVLVLVRGMGLFKDLPVVLCNRPVAFNQDIKALVPQEGVDSEYLAFALIARKSDILRHVDSAGHGTGRLDTDLLKSTPLPLPPLPEQHKIAEVLRTWDEAIEKLEALRAAKEKFLNNFYSMVFQPNSNLNKNWPKCKIGEFVNVVSKKALPGDDLPLYSLTIEDGVVAKSDRYDREFLVKNKASKLYKIVQPKDIVFNPSNLRWGAIAQSNEQRDVLVSPIYEILRHKPGTIDLNFLVHALTCRYQIRRFATKVEGTLIERMAVKADAFLLTTITVPKEKKEQEHLATAMDTANEEIALIKRQIAAIALQKRGLMQKLLTGEWRV